jgi:hypothetical protein
MPTKENSLVERVQSSYRQLAVAATNLNAVSDQLGKTIVQLDSSLKKLNLGVSAWVTISSNEWPDGSWASDQLGYDKIDGEWGIGIRKVSGSYTHEECGENSTEWLFHTAPRTLRIAAIEKIPELIDELTKQADATTKKAIAKLDQANQLAAAINASADKK